MIVGGEEWVTSLEDELERRLHPLLRRDDMSEKNKKKLIYFRNLSSLKTAILCHARLQLTRAKRGVLAYKVIE